MAARLPRLAAGAVACSLLAGLLATQVVDGSKPRARVGTEGPALDGGDHEASEDVAGFLPGDQVMTSTTTTPSPARRSSPTSSTPSAVEDRDASPTTTTTSGGRTSSSLGPSDLRGRIIYVRQRPSGPTTWSMRPDGTDRRPEVGCSDPLAIASLWAAVSPDGTRLLYDCASPASSGTGFDALFGRYDLFVQPVDGGDAQRAYESKTGLPLHAVWSPDGHHLAVREQAQAVGTQIVDLERGTSKPLVLPDGSSPEVLAWSPDGARLLLPGLVVLDLATGVTTSLVPGSISEIGLPLDTLPSWSPDGTWIYYLHDTGLSDRDTGRTLRTIERVEVSSGRTENVVPWTLLEGYGLQAQPVVFAASGDLLLLDGDNLWTMEANGRNAVLLDEAFDGTYLSAPRP